MDSVWESVGFGSQVQKEELSAYGSTGLRVYQSRWEDGTEWNETERRRNDIWNLEGKIIIKKIMEMGITTRRPKIKMYPPLEKYMKYIFIDK